MAKAVHLKNKKGESFTVTPAGFAEIKKDAKWRQNYDLVGEVNDEEFAGKSESAMGTGTPTNNNKKVVTRNDKEESSKDIFSGKSEIEKFEAHMEKAGDHMNAGEFDKAKAEVLKAQAISPNSKFVANFLEQINKEALNKTANDQENAKDAAEHIATAKKFFKKKELEAAKEEVEKALALFPESLEASNLLDEIVGAITKAASEEGKGKKK